MSATKTVAKKTLTIELGYCTIDRCDAIALWVVAQVGRPYGSILQPDDFYAHGYCQEHVLGKVSPWENSPAQYRTIVQGPYGFGAIVTVGA